MPPIGERNVNVSTRATRTFDPALTATCPFFGTGVPSTSVCRSDSGRSLKPSGNRRSSKCQRLICKACCGSSRVSTTFAAAPSCSQPAEADDVLIRKPALVRRLLDADVRREKLAVAPVQHEELGGSERTALQSVGSGALLEHLARQADLAGFSTAGDAGAEIHRIAAHRDAIGQHRPPVRANAPPQLMLARARRVCARHGALQLHKRVGGRKGEECPIAGSVDEPAVIAGRDIRPPGRRAAAAVVGRARRRTVRNTQWSRRCPRTPARPGAGSGA